MSDFAVFKDIRHAVDRCSKYICHVLPGWSKVLTTSCSICGCDGTFAQYVCGKNQVYDVRKNFTEGGHSEHSLFIQQLLSPDGAHSIPEGVRSSKKHKGPRRKKRSEKLKTMLKPPALATSTTKAEREISAPVDRNVLPGSLRDSSQKPILESCSQFVEDRCLAAKNNGQRCSKRRASGNFCTLHLKLAGSQNSKDNLFDVVNAPASDALSQWEHTQLQLAIEQSFAESEEHRVEMEASNKVLDARLKKEGLRRVEILADGNCQFGAVIRSGHLRVSIAQLRSEVVTWRHWPKCFKKRSKRDSKEKRSVYLRYIEKDGSWGGPLTLLALSHILRRPIRVVTDSTSDSAYASLIEPPEIIHPDTWGSEMVITCRMENILMQSRRLSNSWKKRRRTLWKELNLNLIQIPENSGQPRAETDGIKTYVNSSYRRWQFTRNSLF